VSADERVGSESRASLAGDLALLGGRLALERFHHAQVSMRPGGSLVPDADLAIQDALGREIVRCFPTDGLAGEEGLLDGTRAHTRYEWILGPIDTTTDFARGLPGFAISVGVLRDGAVFAGAVYDPIARWLFTGCAGRGAWLNERPLHVRGAVRSEGTLFSARTPFTAGTPEFVDEWMRRYHMRRFGSTALHLCYVALGGLDFVYDDRATVWDIAGAAAVILEAGGMLTADDGAPLFPTSAAQAAGAPIALLAGHPLAYAAALRDLQAARPLAAGR
jgi:myo-inositol-1(or 4)-monophosphatase